MYETVKKGIVTLVLTMALGAAWAGEYAITAGEMRLLPPYCRALSPGNYTPDAVGLRIRVKPPRGFLNVHHFCHGLKYLIRAQRAFGDRKSRDYRLTRAIDEFDYVIGARPPGSRFYQAYVYVSRARAYEMKGDLAAAQRDLFAAAKLAPKFPLTYVRLSDLFLKMERADMAEKVLKIGLKKTKSKTIAHRLRKLRQALQSKPASERRESTTSG